METRQEVMAWRRGERERLLALRQARSVESRQLDSARIAETLDGYCRAQGLPAAGSVISGYWPLRGEPDLRPWLARMHGAGNRIAMPVVVTKGAPLQFRAWQPGAKMTKGFWDIPVPADPREVLPDFLLAPVVGFDAECYRLGYGGGYFDRTLEQLRAGGRAFHAVGIGFDFAQLESIRPLPHDIPLQAVVTESRAINRPVS